MPNYNGRGCNSGGGAGQFGEPCIMFMLCYIVYVMSLNPKKAGGSV